MKKIAIAATSVFSLVVMVLAAVIAPDTLSLIVVALMLVIMLVGTLLGTTQVVGFILGLGNARKNIAKIVDLQPSAPWMYVQQNEHLFQQKELDRLLKGYIARSSREHQDGKIISDIEDTINEESLALRSWHGMVQLIPGTLTAIGLAGTFIGLIFGISSIGFSSVDSTIASIETMLSGIRTAFYTSIVGIVFSIIFNFSSRMIWQTMLRELGLFIEEFHLYILPSEAEQSRQKQEQDMKKVLMLLERLPKVPGFSLSEESANRLSADIQNEKELLSDIQNGLENGEFVFYVQPRCDLSTHKIIGGEALMRWNHSSMGMVSPMAFLPVLERNGYIAKLDRSIWENVCQEIRKWLDEGKRPLPMSINISKTDVMTMDITSHFIELTRKYKIPPMYLELEISSSAYLQCGETIRVLERELRQSGFRVIADGFNGDFTAMNILKDAEVDAIKLDLRAMQHEEGEKRESIQAVYDQATALHIPMIAEGIESAEEMNILRRAGYKEGQGYHLYKPMAMDTYKQLVEESER